MVKLSALQEQLWCVELLNDRSKTPWTKILWKTQPCQISLMNGNVHKSVLSILCLRLTRNKMHNKWSKLNNCIICYISYRPTSPTYYMKSWSYMVLTFYYSSHHFEGRHTSWRRFIIFSSNNWSIDSEQYRMLHFQRSRKIVHLWNMLFVVKHFDHVLIL